MSKPKISDQLKSLEGYINDIPLVIDPCRLCDIWKKKKAYDTGHEEDGDWVEGPCRRCCWYYDSQFVTGGKK